MEANPDSPRNIGPSGLRPVVYCESLAQGCFKGTSVVNCNLEGKRMTIVANNIDGPHREILSRNDPLKIDERPLKTDGLAEALIVRMVGIRASVFVRK
jgi:hypothetical protein